MDKTALNRPLPLLGGLSPRQFMARHWQKQPLLIRGAWPGVQAPASRIELFALAGSDAVESRCVEQTRRAALPPSPPTPPSMPQGTPKDRSPRAGKGQGADWKLRHGPFQRRALPPLQRPGWTLLVQGLNLHLDSAHQMMRAFDFIAQVRQDDLMLSYASDGGGVGPHVDSYDVFLLQVAGRRRWSIAPPDPGARLIEGLPLKVLAEFTPEQEWVLEPGDMLYLPPGWGHEGVAVGGDCMTASIGFRAPTAAELVTALAARMTDEVADGAAGAGYSRRHTDPRLGATSNGAQIPSALERFAATQMRRLLSDEALRRRALGSWLTEPHPTVWFEGCEENHDTAQPLWADRRSRIAYDQDHLYFNGEAYRVEGRDADILRRLADEGRLGPDLVRRLSLPAREAVQEWWRLGWLIQKAL